MLGDLMGKLGEAQQRMEVTKKRLDGVFVDAEVENGLIKITATANRKITNVSIDADFLKSADKDELEDFIILAVNRVIEKADKVNEAEMQGVAMGMMPNLQSLF